ncbi:MAG: hypothetical protein L3K16_06145 [Thermoplasmata archaeon]|nr:hypothetical protein [Thermoplasmata archaeon]
MENVDPRALRDLGDVPGTPGLQVHADRIKAELERLFPGRVFRCFPVSAREPVRVPTGYHPIEIHLDREASEAAAAFQHLRDRVELALTETELMLSQPGTGGTYLRTDDGLRRPILGPHDEGHQSVVGWSFTVYIAPLMVRAEDIELMNERVRSQ